MGWGMSLVQPGTPAQQAACLLGYRRVPAEMFDAMLANKKEDGTIM